MRMHQTGNSCEKFRISLSSSLVNFNLQIRIKPSDQQQIDTSQHDLVTELNEHEFKTAAQSKLYIFRCIIICYVLNLSF